MGKAARIFHNAFNNELAGEQLSPLRPGLSVLFRSLNKHKVWVNAYVLHLFVIIRRERSHSSYESKIKKGSDVKTLDMHLYFSALQLVIMKIMKYLTWARL